MIPWPSISPRRLVLFLRLTKLSISGQVGAVWLAFAVSPSQQCAWSLRRLLGSGCRVFLNSLLGLVPGGHLGATLRSRATSGRTIIHPLGNWGYDFVARGNLLLARVMVILLICSYKQVRFLLEQPAGSCLALHPRWEWFCEHVSVLWQAFQCVDVTYHSMRELLVSQLFGNMCLGLCSSGISWLLVDGQIWRTIPKTAFGME